MTPYYTDGQIMIFHGDCREILPRLGTGTVRLVCTDPPYNVSLPDADITVEDRKDIQRDFGQWDQAWSPDLLLAESARLLYAGGSLLSFCSDKLVSSYLTDGLKHRGTLVWEKTDPPPNFRSGYVSATEWIVWCQKIGAPAVWNGGGAVRNILRYPIVKGNGSARLGHPTQKPLGLIIELIQRHSDRGDMILDPYMGVGTTLRAAKDTGRRAMGIELDERWCKLAAKRLGQDVLDLDYGDPHVV